MKKIIIKTAIKQVGNIINALQNNFEIVGVTDNNIQKWGTLIHGIRVLSPFHGASLYHKGEIDAIIIPCSLGYSKIQSIKQELLSFGYYEEDIYVTDIKMDDRGEISASALVNVDEYIALDYLEFHVAHRCNLNCKSCCHFSSITTKDFPDFNDWLEGMTQLKKRISYIKEIRLLGGEPLLNPELVKYVIQTRKQYPESQISIVSNGILVRQMSEGLIQCLKENNVKVDISVYPAVHRKMEDILIYLDKAGLLGGVLYVCEFTKLLSREKKAYPYSSTEKICHCPNLVGKMIAPCPLIAYMDDFNSKFQEDFVYQDGFVSLSDDTLTGKQLLEKLYRPKVLCDYCRSYMSEGKMRGGNDWSNQWMSYSREIVPQSSDWILEE